MQNTPAYLESALLTEPARSHRSAVRWLVIWAGCLGFFSAFTFWNHYLELTRTPRGLSVLGMLFVSYIQTVRAMGRAERR